MQSVLMQRFEQDGYHLVRGLLSPARVADYTQRILSIVNDPAEKRFQRPRAGLAHLDGITLRPDFWDLIFDPAITATVRELIGPDIMYVRHSDIHWNTPLYPSWHRDTTMHITKILARDRLVPYRVVRPLIYLTETEFAILNDSHKNAGDHRDFYANQAMRVLRRVGFPHLVTLGKSTLLHLMPGDCLFINVLCFHSGCYVDHFEDQPKGGVFLAYGLKNQNSIDQSHDYGTRSGMETPPQLIRQLKDHDLWHEEIDDSGL